MKPTIIQAMTDPALFGGEFGGESWSAWRTILKAVFSLPLEGDELERFEAISGRKNPPANCRELWAVVGRRGGKTRIAALVAVYLAIFHDWSGRLSAGERGFVLIVCPDRRQGRIAFQYIVSLIESAALLSQMIQRRTRETLELSNNVIIEVATANYRTVRGYTCLALILDELAFLRSEDSANPDFELINAVRPAMATVEGSRLIAISSPYARRGELFKAHQRYYGVEDDGTLVIQAPSKTMNPELAQRIIDRARQEDPSAAAAEWDAEFRVDVEDFLTLEAVEAATDSGVIERPPDPRISYRAFCDPSGGSGRDSMTLAISHEGDGVRILDALRERRPPFSPESVVGEFCDLLKAYRVRTVEGDRYAGEWPREQFKKCGVTYEPASSPKSDLYLNLLPAINSGRVRLLDVAKLKTQLVSLERRTSRSGKDSIDHPPGSHDDLANAVAGALVESAGRLAELHEVDLLFYD